MLTAPTTMHADEPPPWSASAQPPLDISRWRSDGRLSNLVAQRFDMDNDEALRFALACGGDLDATMGHEPFDRHLRTMILRYGLTSLFHITASVPIIMRSSQPATITTRTQSFQKPWHSGAPHIVLCRRCIR